MQPGTNRTFKEDMMERSYDRPMGVSVIAVLLLLGGGLLLVTQLLVFGRLSDASTHIGISGMLLQGAIGFLGLLGTASGIGMWKGKKWGWWLALFYFAYGVTRNGNVLLSISGLYEAFGSPSDDITSSYVKYGVRALWDVLLLYYLCRDSVTDYFQTSNVNKMKAIGSVFALCVLIFVAGSLVM